MAKKSKKKAEGKFIKALYYCILLILVIIIVFQTANKPVPAPTPIDPSEMLTQFGNDINEMREYLLLPHKNYGYLETKKEELDSNGLASESVIKFTTDIGKEYEYKKRQDNAHQLILDLKKDSDFYSQVKKTGLYPAYKLNDGIELTTYKFYEGDNAIASLILNKTEVSFMIQSIMGNQPITWTEESSLKNEVINYLVENIDKIKSTKIRIEEQKQAIKNMWNNEDIIKILSENKLSPSLQFIENESGYDFYINNIDNEAIFTISINRKNGNFIVQGIEYASIDDLMTPLINILSTLSGESQRTLGIKGLKRDLENMIATEDFANLLNSSNLTIENPIEEGSRIIYKLINSDDNKLVGSIIFENETGNMYFYRESDKVELNIDDVLSGSKKND